MTEASRARGVQLGVVTRRDAARHRVWLRLPWLPDGDESAPARVLAPAAGRAGAVALLPSVCDQVAVVFAGGDVASPIVVGGVWAAGELPPRPEGDPSPSIRGAAGQRVAFDDRADAERLTIADATGRAAIELDAGRGVTRIVAGGDVAIRAGGAVRLRGQVLDLAIARDAALAGGAVELAGGAVGLSSAGPLAVRAARVGLADR